MDKKVLLQETELFVLDMDGSRANIDLDLKQMGIIFVFGYRIVADKKKCL